MSYFIDTVALSINKKGEELCGDQVEMANTDSGKILVLSDGLGSGVKANILATLTAKIAVTMLKENATLEDTILTIAKTLPVCSVRKLSYSTFTIVKASDTGNVDIVEFDNPSYFFLRQGRQRDIPRKIREIQGKVVYESSLSMAEGDTLLLVSDGVVHAGVGKLLNFGWQWADISDFLESTINSEPEGVCIAHEVLSYTNVLYDFKPGDDASVVSMTMKKRTTLHLFTGPPKNPKDDDLYVRAFEEARGIKVISGGTTANIIADKRGAPLQVSLSEMRSDLPPTAIMEGADLITEGILTLSCVVDMLRDFRKGDQCTDVLLRLAEDHGASKLCKYLIHEASDVVIWMGTAVNAAHQQEGFVFDYQKKVALIEQLRMELMGLGRNVTLYSI